MKGNTKRKWLLGLYIFTILSAVFSSVAYAAGDPMSAVNNLSNFIFGLIRAIGMIILGFGVVQVGLSFKSHDPSQRANGFLTLAGGIIITFTKEILNIITG
ncbi:glutamyl-tRNA amidotransferase [Paenibacillus sp. FSL R7-0179]|uniref:glutamyl-tRNA amidotransferase n=1 Tax=Paenibacillus sp. FSL R7-0179 TaxID=2921672 RepID=UPI0030FC5941